jgi:hypothetical protein
MKIVDFIAEFKDKKIKNTQIDPNAVNSYIMKTLEVKTYLPFAKKRDICARVLKVCNTMTDMGLVKVDSVSRYITFTVALLSAYTNLEFSSGEDGIDSIDEYDMLCENDLLNPILEVIGGEYTACNNMLNMMMDDMMTNYNTVENVVVHASNHLLAIVNRFADVLSQKVNSLNFDLSQIDIEQYKGLVEKLTQK